MQMMIMEGLVVTLALLAVGYFWRWRRFAHERAVFGTAIDRHWTNWWAGLIGGGLAGLVVSGIAALGHLALPGPVGLWLGALTLLGLLGSGLGYAPAVLGFSGIAAVGTAGLAPWLALPAVDRWAWQWLALLALLGAANAGLLRFLAPPIDVPAIHAGKRGAQIASYTRRQFYWVPVVLPLIGASTSTWALVPLVLGAALTTRKQLPTAAIHAWARHEAWSAGLTAILAAGTWWQPRLALAALWGQAGLSLALLIWHHHAAAAGHSFVSQTDLGVRLVAIQPDTPASKMGLQAGDIVLQCNQVPVRTEAALYAALQAHPTYCRLRVQRLDGAIKLTETAIFKGAPHELGMITFTEDEHEEDLSRR
ncbi:PDZ domain-containing protein [Lacticaseibacillus absianus]|uniref:PDZ domain-containing protein n=1 Tax=Lacticaseibacillus absianus TaxID=2729623 RepID=UPI0015CD9009|nr:PDZ domain-containing protein [Lacticaseibacillus absianus]